MRKKTVPSKTTAIGKRTRMVPLLERCIPQIRALDWRMMKCKLLLVCLFQLISYYACFYSIEVTPPPTPSPVKAVGGKKRAIAVGESDEEDVFVPRYYTIWLCHVQNVDC